MKSTVWKVCRRCGCPSKHGLQGPVCGRCRRLKLKPGESPKYVGAGDPHYEAFKAPLVAAHAERIQRELAERGLSA